MFLDESAFEDDSKTFKRRDISPKREQMVAKYSGAANLQVEDVDDVEDKGDVFGSAGGLGTPSSSRARMLAQQREIQLKNRQKAMQSGGMIRSSLDEMRSSTDAQFTPAIRQFSAPKTVKDGSSDAQGEENSEFRLPQARKPVAIPTRTTTGRASRFSDDDDDDDDDYRRRRQDNNAAATKPRTVQPRSRFDDDDDDDDDDNDNYGGRRNPGNTKNSNGRDNNSNNGRSKGWTSASRGGDDDDENHSPSRASAMTSSSRSPYTQRTEYNSNVSSDSALELTRPLISSPPPPLNLSNMRQFLTSPVPKANGIVQCYIRRNKSGTNRLFPVYSLYLKDGDRFLMCSKKRPNNKTSNYLVSMGEGDLSRDGANYLGKLRSNFVGTEFEIFDNGHNPNDGETDNMAGGHVRKDLGAVMYAPNVLGSRGPRKMQCAVPRIVDDEGGESRGGASTRPRSNSNGDESILARMKDRNHAGLAYLINKPPRWNEQVGAYVLNFNGRVTMASVKNFQLVDPDEHNIVVLQFGRVAKDEFTMDMQFPISPFQAFAITLSSFDSKIACD